MSNQSAAQEWRAAYERVSALIAAQSAEQMAVRVPACPAWTAHGLLSHVVGLGRDVLDGHEPDDHNPAWTQAQVDARRDRTTAEVLAEWSGFADEMTDYLATTSPRALGDLVIHEQDLRGALGVPGARDNAGLAGIRETMAGLLAHRLGDRGVVRLQSPTWTWSSADGAPDVVLGADAFDFVRALTGRRTADELRSWVVAGDLEPLLDAFALFGPLPSTPLAGG